MIRTSRLEADLATASSIVGASTVVALPPSSLDAGGVGGALVTESGAPLTTESGEAIDIDNGGSGMRVYVSGALIIRAYDAQLEQP